MPLVKRFKKPGFLFLLCLLIPFFASADEAGKGPQELVVFYSPSCHKCIQVKNELIPQIEKEFKAGLNIVYRDISDIRNYKSLLSLKKSYAALNLKNTWPVFYCAGYFMNAQGNTGLRLRSFIAEAIKNPRQRKEEPPLFDPLAQFRLLTPFAVIGAGLIDGINPCAFTVMVFFMSFLALQGYRKIELLLIGLAFSFAVFLTYILIGIGLFSFIYQLKGFWLAAKIFNFSIGIFSIILGVMALFDFFRFKRTGSTEALTLQLPDLVKNRIHAIIGIFYRKNPKAASAEKRNILRLALSALLTGFLVSILEAVCTGQVYLPTITFIMKTTQFKLQAWGYLLIYNLMFILPLLAVFLFALFGVTAGGFSRLLKKHLLAVKILMALLFFGLGVLLLWRA